MKRILLITIPVIILYTALFFYGRQAIIPRNKALSLVFEADKIVTGIQAKDRAEEIEQMKKYVSLYEQANKINLRQYPLLGDYPMLEAYIDKTLEYAKTFLTYEEDIHSSKIRISQADYEKKLQEFASTRQNILNTYGSFARTQLWMLLIFLR